MGMENHLASENRSLYELLGPTPGMAQSHRSLLDYRIAFSHLDSSELSGPPRFSKGNSFAAEVSLQPLISEPACIV
jgi:hypothetical protein